MDTGTYPAESVKTFCKQLVVMHVNRDGGKECAKLVKEFDVHAYPTLLMIKPNGEILKKVEGGLEKPEDFLGKWTNDGWNAWTDALNAKPPDLKAAAKAMFDVIAWYPDSDGAKEATRQKDRVKDDATFKAEWDSLQKAHDLMLLTAKADAQMKMAKKKEAIETYKKLATAFPEEKEGKNAAALLKKMGVKLDAPPPAEKK
jgi:hypothetical protein